MNRVYHILRVSLALIFISASIDKILHPADFAVIIRQYHILPLLLTNLAAIVLPWLELFLGLLLLVRVWLDGAILIINLLLMIFWGTLLFTLSRGLDIHCGCFSTKPDPSTSVLWSVIRDGLFMVMGGGLAWMQWRQGRQPVHWYVRGSKSKVSTIKL